VWRIESMNVDISVRSDRGITVVELSGKLTYRAAPEAEERILEQVRPEGRLCLDLSRVTLMTSAGLRVLLRVYRAVHAQGGRVVLVGASPDLRDTMEVTGFHFFSHHDSLESGLAALGS
jgi:anti-sigma B factor antagonist